MNGTEDNVEENSHFERKKGAKASPKRVLNFVHLLPPCCGVEIVDNLYKCLKDWCIENKVFTISVDNASNNDSTIRILSETFSKTKRLPCGGKMFHLQLPHRKLILECKIRWNSTYEMLAVAIKFKDVFPMFKEKEPRYLSCTSNEDWLKVEKLYEILEAFNSKTNIVFGSEYPTSNLFLNEVYRIKVLLDKRFQDPNEDKFVHDMVGCMKQNIDKYWGECNLMMPIGAILDRRCK
uniref:hAT-like transposase RNase-H fold domain-containing protein n=1 Tax=Lactuca sativa TaxID=4236 RepID=A0A9R1UU18_LACSA|nr:hypothetical protein LSAT_V11C800391930 [Lactuca sativa]